MTVRRFNPYPPRPVGRLGFTANSQHANATVRTRLLAAGATYIRFQPSWENVENYASGALALSANELSTLAWCAANNVAPILVAVYGPPFSTIATLTVNTSAAIGAYNVVVNEAVTSVDVPYCYLTKADGTQVVAEGLWSYPGALIHSVNTSTKTLTLAAALSTGLTSGTSLHVQRVRYKSLPDADSTRAEVTAYLRYAQFLADQIAAAGCREGWVELWNEPPWAHDGWNNRFQMYDTPPGDLVDVSRLEPILDAALDVTDLPRGVRFINGASHKTGFSSTMTQPSRLSQASQVTSAVGGEGIHPYGANPESRGWDPSSTYETFEWYEPLNRATDSGFNFRNQACKLDLFAAAHGVAPRLFATESGADLADDTRQAIYLLRWVAASWGMNVTPVVHTLADSGSNFNVVDSATYVARTAHTALARLMTKVAAIGPAGGTSRRLPTPIGVPDSASPVMLVGLYGLNGALMLAWQRTWSTDGTWATIARPVRTLPVRFHIASGVTVVDSVDLLTGSTVTVTPSAGTFTLNLTDTPIAIRTA